MNRPFSYLLLILGVAICVFGISMTVMAVRYSEWGRVLFYGMIALFSLELVIYVILKLKKKS